jgi:UDP-glucose 4-epimerase
LVGSPPRRLGRPFLSTRRAIVQIHGNTFLVTGGSGFIGSHVVDELLDAGAGKVVVLDKVIRRDNLELALSFGRVELVEADVADVESLQRHMEGAHGVFHMAVLPLGPCDEQPRLCLEVNVVGTFNVFEAARDAGVQKIVFSSASSVYGDTFETMDESHPLNARSFYGATKIAGEYFLRAFHEQSGIDYVVLRYMNVYGPRQDGGLVINVMRRIQSGRPPTIMGDGSQSFDFVHVADVAKANVRAMDSDVSDEAFNIGGGNEATVREVVEQLVALSGSNLEPDVHAEEEVPMMRRVGSNKKAASLLEWKPSFDLERGLGDVIGKD